MDKNRPRAAAWDEGNEEYSSLKLKGTQLKISSFK